MSELKGVNKLLQLGGGSPVSATPSAATSAGEAPAAEPATDPSTGSGQEKPAPFTPDEFGQALQRGLTEDDLPRMIATVIAACSDCEMLTARLARLERAVAFIAEAQGGYVAFELRDFNNVQPGKMLIQEGIDPKQNVVVFKLKNPRPIMLGARGKVIPLKGK